MKITCADCKQVLNITVKRFKKLVEKRAGDAQLARTTYSCRSCRGGPVAHHILSVVHQDLSKPVEV